jgi:hypothetical protein
MYKSFERVGTTAPRRCLHTQLIPERLPAGFQDTSTASEVARELASPLFQRSSQIAYGFEAPLWMSLLNRLT